VSISLPARPAVLPTVRRLFSLFLLAVAAAAPIYAQKTAVPVKASLPGKAEAPPRRAVVVPRDTAVLGLFEQSGAVQWVRYFRGRLDDVASVEVALGYDGRHCRGFLTYTRSRLRLRLEGQFDETHGLRLQERDVLAGVTGNLHGQIDQKRLIADWSSADQSLGSRLEAEEFVPGHTLPVTAGACGDNKWAHRYIAKWNGGRADFVVQRVHNGELSGYLWLEADGHTYDIRGRCDRDGAFEAQALLPGGQPAGQLQGRLKDGELRDCTWMGSGTLRQFDFTLRENFVLGCLEYADFATSYDAVYPRTASDGCNRWLDDQLKRWAERCKTAFTGQKIVPSAANRGAQRASAWADIACWTENVFSGYLTFADTWSEQTQGQAFNFDLRTGKEITFADLFQKNFDAKAWFAEYARREMPKLGVFATDPKYREWITRQGFPLFAVRRDGIELSTVFHPYYGRQVVVVPYQQLKPHMKRGNPIADLVK
jgi:hypothetical protein